MPNISNFLKITYPRIKEFSFPLLLLVFIVLQAGEVKKHKSRQKKVIQSLYVASFAVTLSQYYLTCLCKIQDTKHFHAEPTLLV